MAVKEVHVKKLCENYIPRIDEGMNGWSVWIGILNESDIDDE